MFSLAMIARQQLACHFLGAKLLILISDGHEDYEFGYLPGHRAACKPGTGSQTVCGQQLLPRDCIEAKNSYTVSHYACPTSCYYSRI